MKTNSYVVPLLDQLGDSKQILDHKMNIQTFICFILKSPEVEPELSILLYVCADCKSEVLQRQLKDPEWFEEKPQPVDPLTKIVKLHDELTAVQKKILERENEV